MRTSSGFVDDEHVGLSSTSERESVGRMGSQTAAASHPPSAKTLD
jgi:hypothetical protein